MSPLRAEVRLVGGVAGQDGIWVVPEYTRLPRAEITPEHVGRLARIVEVLGGRVVSYQMRDRQTVQPGARHGQHR